MRVGFYIRLYFKLQMAQLQGRLAYEKDFWIGIIGALLTQVPGIAFASVVMRQVPAVLGWTLPEVICLYGLVVLPRGLVEVFCDGPWALRELLSTGEFDQLLLRPIPPWIQIMTRISSVHGLGGVALGVALLVQAFTTLGIALDFGRFALLLGTVVGSTLLFASLNLLTNCIGFWEPSGTGALPLLALNLSELTKYPLPLYGKGLQTFLVGCIPLAFVSYFPALILLGRRESFAWVGWLSPLAGPLFAFFVSLVWSAGLRRYEGAGH